MYRTKFFEDGCRDSQLSRRALWYSNRPSGYSLPRTGRANALSLAGFSDTEIQKMGRWRSDTFKEYISEGLAVFSEGMSKEMGKNTSSS